MDYILFSPVGKTDPMTNFHDGSLMHICRKYKPAKVYLYLSQEMLALHHLDNRYCRCLEWLQEKMNFQCTIALIERPELVEVQLFDRFYDDFEREVQKIQQENPEATILFNISSGTPAMKSALQFLAASSENMYVPIQVSTPQNGANREQYDFAQYDLATRWERNADNETPYKDRCVESETAMLNKRIKLEVISKHIAAYDYQAAWRVAQSIERLLSPEIMAVLEGAAKRWALDIGAAEAAFKKAGVSVIPVRISDRSLIVEYLLWLQVKQQRGDLVDFIRGLTPVLVDVLLLALKEKCRLDFNRYCQKDSKNVTWVKRYKLKRNPPLLAYLDKQEPFCKGGLKDAPLGAEVLVKVLEKECKDSSIVHMAQQLRMIEKEARNPTAHEIISVTDGWLKKLVGYDSLQIMKLLKDFTQGTCAGINRAVWKSYEAMNGVILEVLNRPNSASKE